MKGRTPFLLTGMLLVALLVGAVTAIAGGVPAASTPPSFAQAAKLTDQFGTADEGFGVSPAVSTDGSTIAVSAPGANGNKGAVFVYVLQSGVWVQTATLTLPSEPSGFLSFGQVVAISADGSTVATNEVVSGADGGSYVEVFTRQAGGWGSESNPVQIAQPPNATSPNNTFGNALAVSANGSTVVAGDAGEAFEEQKPEYNGAAYVITKPAGGWSSGAALSDLLPTGLSGETNFGEKVAISADGKTVAVLAPGLAAIYVFTATGAAWPATASPVGKLTSSDTAIDDNGGFSSLAISGDASTIVTGARPNGANVDPDTVDLWARPAGGAWASSTIESAQLTSTSASADLGWSLAASQDGSAIAAGAPFTVVGTNNQQGAVELYERPGTAWTSETQSQQLTATDGAANDDLGRAVGLSADGSTVVAGAPNAAINGSNEEGAAYVFNTADDVSIAAADPVNEPATGSVSQSFTVSVPQPAAANITVDYNTIDGTATSANNNYTPTTSGSVTIPQGSTSATITVPVDDGNGTATTASLSYQVQLTSSSGPAISSSADIATGVIKIPEVMGTVTDQNGKPLAGTQMVMSGTASSGQTVLRQATSSAIGTYTIYADPGSYDLGATPPSSSPGELTPAPCSDATVTTTEAGQTVEDCLLTLAPGDDQTVNFTQGKLLVTGITFQQLNAATEQLETVGSLGTIDGNRVQVTATIENVGDTDQTTDVQFGSPIDNSATVGATVSNVAVPAGKSVQVDQILDTSGLAWDDSGQPDVERQIMITLTNGGSHLGQTLDVEPKPVILVHGLFSNAATWDAYIDGSGVTDVAGRVRAHKAGGGFLSSVTPGWQGFAVGDGQAPGVMDTSPFEHPGNTIAQNAFQLAQYITGVRTKVDAQHVDIVAHSLGGLISRYYIQELMPDALPGDSRPVVDHLVEMGTPNLGSNCAYLALAAGAPIALTPSRAAGPDINEPLYQLTPSYLSLFNRQITDLKGVAVSIMAGNGFLGVSCTGVGPNDGVVSVPNAEWDIPNRDLEDLVHTSMTGSATAFNQYVAPHLEIGPGVVGGGTYSTGTLSGGGASERRAADQARSDAVAAAAGSLPDGSPSTPNLCLATSAVDSLSGGGTAKLKKTGAVSDAIAVPAGAGSISVTVLAAPNVTTDLVEPSGRVGQAIVAGTPAAAGLFRTLKVTSPKAGTWHLRSSQADGEAPTQLSLSVSFKHPPIQATLTIRQLHYAKAGSRLRFAVRVATRRRTRGSAAVSVEFETASGGTDTLRLRHAGSTNYTAVSAPLSAIPSVADVRAVQGGTLSERSWSIATSSCRTRDKG